MDKPNNLSQHLEHIVELARFAPSVHNTQPWRVTTDGDFLVVTLDPEHTLHEGDPTGRETVISLGIFVEALSIAARVDGYTTTHVQLLQDRSARLKLSFSEKQDASALELSECLRSRSSDRSIYRPAEITPQMIHAISSSWNHEALTIHVITDSGHKERIALLTSRAIRVAMSNPKFRKELSRYLVSPWSHKRRGIALKSLYIPRLLAYFEPVALRLGIGLNKEASLEKRRWLSASGIVAITTKGDMPKNWFDAGRTYLHTSLIIEHLGLAQATSAATVEASNYHEDVENMLGTSERLQAVLRIGLGSPYKEFSPRISAETILR